MKRYLTFIFLWFCLLSAPSLASNLYTIVQSNTLRVGTMYGTEGFFLLNESPAGFDYELTSAFADFLGVQLDVRPFADPKRMLNSLKRGEIDLIASPFQFASEHLTHVEFGPAYQYFDQVIVTSNNNPKRNALVERYSMHADALKHKALEQGIPWQATLEYDSEELLQMVLAEEIGYTVTTSSILNRARLLNPELLPYEVINRNLPRRWLFSKSHNDALLGVMLEFFGQYRVSGALKALNEAYFGHVQKINFVDTKSFIDAVNDTLPNYKEWFKKYADDLDWRLLAAVSYQESHWDPNAVSVTGVRGLMMLTRPTAREMGVTSRINPEQSIMGGSKYLAKMKQRLPARINEPDRTFMALAAYNIGLGHLEDARVLTQRAGLNPDLWVDVKQYLPLLRKKQYYTKTKFGYAHGDVAVQYVENIRRYYESLRFIDENIHQAATQ